MKNNDIHKRKTAMDWWNTLSPLRKELECAKNADFVGINRHYTTLTGREIEKIYTKTPSVFKEQ